MTALVDELNALGLPVVTGGSENHLCLLNVRDKGLTGYAEAILSACHVDSRA